MSDVKFGRLTIFKCSLRWQEHIRDVVRPSPPRSLLKMFSETTSTQQPALHPVLQPPVTSPPPPLCGSARAGTPRRVSCSDWLPPLSIASSGVTRTAAALGTPSFSWLCSIPLCGCTVFCPFVLHGWPTFGPLPPFSSRDSCCSVCMSEHVSTLGPSAVTPEGRPAGPRARPAFRFSGTRRVGLR